MAVNPAVSLLIDTRQRDSKQQTKALTITGIFQGSVDESKKSDILAGLLRINPDLKAFGDDLEVEIIVIRVKAVQLLEGIKDSYFEVIT